MSKPGRISDRRTFREYLVPIHGTSSRRITNRCRAAFAQQEHAAVDRIRARQPRVASAILRSFTETPPCCTSRRASLFDAAGRPRHDVDDAEAVAVEFARGDRRRRHIAGDRQQAIGDRRGIVDGRSASTRRTATAFADSARAASSAPCTSVVTSIARGPAAPPLFRRALATCASSSSISSRVEKGEELQVARSRRDRRCSARTGGTLNGGVRAAIEPDRARFGLAELRARRGRHQRRDQAVRLLARAPSESARCRR